MLLNLFRGLASAIANKSVSDGQVLFSTDTNELSIDVGNTRYKVKDGTAMHTLNVNVTNGHLYYE